ELAREAGVQVYFAHPSAPHEKGTIENMNGLIRQYFPKKTDFRKVTKSRIRKVEERLNARPRKCLSYQTPLERHHKLMLSTDGRGRCISR
ncbi:MAG: IS30 family transposase, partial [Bdellovibrionota bacterium]